MSLDLTIQSALVSIGGTLLIILLRWLLGQPAVKQKEAEVKQKEAERKQQDAERVIERKQDIEESNSRLAMSLRDQMAKDRAAAIAESEELRKSLAKASEHAIEAIKLGTEANTRLEELGRVNDGLRKENLARSVEYGAQRQKSETQDRLIGEQYAEIQKLKLQNQDQAREMSQLKVVVNKLQHNNDLFVEAMEKAGLPIPDGIWNGDTVKREP